LLLCSCRMCKDAPLHSFVNNLFQKLKNIVLQNDSFYRTIQCSRKQAKQHSHSANACTIVHSFPCTLIERRHQPFGDTIHDKETGITLKINPVQQTKQTVHAKPRRRTSFGFLCILSLSLSPSLFSYFHTGFKFCTMRLVSRKSFRSVLVSCPMACRCVSITS